MAKMFFYAISNTTDYTTVTCNYADFLVSKYNYINFDLSIKVKV